METKELAELLLAAIYYETETMGHTNFIFSIHDVAARLGAAEMDNLKDAAFYLESQGFVLLSADITGGFGAIITDNGCAFIEQGGETGVAKEYKEYLDRMEHLQADNQAPASPAFNKEGLPLQTDLPFPVEEVPGNTVKDIILQILHTLITDGSLDPKMREDLLRDVDTLYVQLLKNTRNVRLIETLMDSLSDIPSIAPLLARLSTVIQRFPSTP
jgi:hypothetical protein